MSNMARLATLILFLTALPLAASGGTETLINVNEHPVGTTISNQGIPHLLKPQTHLLVQQDSYTIARQVLDSLRTSAIFVVIAFVPYYIAAAREVVLKQQSGSHSFITDVFAASAVTVESGIGAFFTLLNLNFYFNYLTSTVSDYVDRENKILACDAHLPRKGFMPVYPEHPWLASHYYQQVVFPEDQKPFLEINVLSNNDDIDPPDDIPEWVNLYQTLSNNRMDKLTIQIDENHTNLLKLMVSGDQVSEEINLIIDAETDVQWDLETITTVCSHFEEAKVYSLFHGETLKAVNRAIESAILGSATEMMVFSPSLTDVLNSQKGAAVIGLSSSQNNPVSRLVYSDHDLFSHHQGFLLLTDSSQHSEDLFSLALSTTSDKLAMSISAQKIWQQHHIKNLMSLLQMGIGHLFYHSMNNHLARSSNLGSAPSSQQSHSFKNSLASVPESTELSKGLVESGFLRVSTDTFKKMIKAGKWSFHNELYNLHVKILNRFALFMLEPSADGASSSKKIRLDQTRYPRQSAQDSEENVLADIAGSSHFATPSVLGERTVDKNIKYGDKFIQVKDVFDKDLLKKVKREISEDRRIFDVDFIKKGFLESSSKDYFRIPKNNIFDYLALNRLNGNLRNVIKLDDEVEELTCHFDKDGKIKEKEAFKRNIIYTRSESVKELCCQALEKMADSLNFSGNKFDNIQFYIMRYPLMHPDRFEGFFLPHKNIKGFPWHRDPAQASLVVQLNDNDGEIEYSGGGLDIGQSSDRGKNLHSPDKGTEETHGYKLNCGYAFTNKNYLVHRGGDINFKCSNDKNKVAEKCIIVVLADYW